MQRARLRPLRTRRFPSTYEWVLLLLRLAGTASHRSPGPITRGSMAIGTRRTVSIGGTTAIGPGHLTTARDGWARGMMAIAFSRATGTVIMDAETMTIAGIATIAAATTIATTIVGSSAVQAGRAFQARPFLYFPSAIRELMTCLWHAKQADVSAV